MGEGPSFLIVNVFQQALNWKWAVRGCQFLAWFAKQDLTAKLDGSPLLYNFVTAFVAVNTFFKANIYFIALWLEKRRVWTKQTKKSY